MSENTATSIWIITVAIYVNVIWAVYRLGGIRDYLKKIADAVGRDKP